MAFRNNVLFTTGTKLALTNPIVTNMPSSMSKKKNLYGDQSSSSQVGKKRVDALNTVALSYGAYQTKNTRETNSQFDALNRVRAGGAVVPPKCRQYNNFVTESIINPNSN